MNLREQMDAAFAEHWQNKDEGWIILGMPFDVFEAGFHAALALLANPSDEMVERCAEGMFASRTPQRMKWENVADLFKDATRQDVRACLKAAAS
ncbi:hypothetical protein [Aquisediminimonas sediminicola]|uniref:hypothetical protein n=1 Tax=Alteraquisediminimonas sediminicola TaxID=2676787 RepID=UPI001C8EED83|nr:hypothetical protein [Aquisediminimonas sediminicola]